MKTQAIPRVTLNDGTTIPQFGFGTLNVQPDRKATPANVERTAEVIGLALELGYRHIDTAQSYGIEQGVGKAIAASGIPRAELYVTSKLSNGEARENLGLERLDRFLMHWPVPTLYDGDHGLAHPSGRRGQILQRVPFGELARPDDIAEMVCWRSSDRARYVSGAVFTVDGAYMAGSADAR